jgi:hypothetical protein
MLSRIHAALHEIRLDLRLAWLSRRERKALRCLGEAAVATPLSQEELLRRVAADIAADRARIEALGAESRAALDADRADLAAVASWVRPIVVLRGLSTRAVLRHRQRLVARGLQPRLETAGEIVAAAEGAAALPTRELADIRAAAARARDERKRWVAPYGDTAFPAWSARARTEVAGLGRAIGTQLRSHFLPKAPALAGLAVGWWVANTYTDSHLRSALRSIGIGSGGTRVVSSSTYEAMSFWLPLLAAAVCAYAGSRISAFYAHRAVAVDGEA